MSKLGYRIGYDFLTREKQIEWSHCIVYREISTVNQNWEIHLDFNIKDNQPCLHFRYYGIKLHAKDKIYIGGSFNNVELTVIKKPHKFNNKLKEADFTLLDSDFDLLKDCITPDVFIVYNNGDSTFKPRCATISSHKYPNRLTSSVDDILAGLKHNVGRCNFKH